ncbi:hypothetical protein BJV74DRAFT_986859 [Russula compacta]|nr:hypothetical protein BJV74DRAFT_986859 [Russula compacta]
MSNRVSLSPLPAHDFDDTHSLSSAHESFIDLSPSPDYHTHPVRRSSRPSSGADGSEHATTTHPYAQHHSSSIRIDTNLMSPRGKPPLPTTPKPDFRRSAYLRSSHARHISISAPPTAVDPSPRESSNLSDLLLERPPTTNYLRPQERAELVRKSKKLTQLLGEPPSLSVAPWQPPGGIGTETPSSWPGRHYSRTSWASQLSTRSVDSIDTMHGHLMLPIDTLSISEPSLVGPGEGKGKGKARGKKTGTTDVTDSASFIAPSDGDSQPIPMLSPHSFPSTPRSCPLDSLEFIPHSHTPEEDRRRRREKIAKLHRFLGSRVPTSLVLGLSDAKDALPALDPTVGKVHTRHPGRRRSSSAAEFKTNSFDPDDRMKEELDEHEKAINVRRAVKMEKVFGVQPPQTLYHTRQSQRPKDRVHSTERYPHREAELPASRKFNQNSYLNRGGRQSRHRAGSLSESTLPLLGPEASKLPGKRASSVYMHYRYSLDSLGDIIDRDDRESLAELHSILTNDQSGAEGSTTLARDDDAKTIRPERRRSLPGRSSSLSLASQFNVNSPSPEMTSFQARRRQAAKLTHFFGVDYRDLIGDVLESIEHYVEEESHRGSLRLEEIQVCRQWLRMIGWLN